MTSENIPSWRVPTLRDLLMPVFRHRRAAQLMFLGMLAGAGVVATTTEPVFESDMKFLVRRERVERAIGAEEDAPIIGRLEVGEEEVYSEVELLKSRDLLQNVARASGLQPASADAAVSACAVRQLERSLAWRLFERRP